MVFIRKDEEFPWLYLFYRRVGSWEQNHNLGMVFLNPCSMQKIGVQQGIHPQKVWTSSFTKVFLFCELNHEDKKAEHFIS